ncbi:MAG: glycosyltransferase [Bacteroidetes bacterium]|nr:glycosyltransferase [Bacteroidota bacterium]
MKKTVIILSLIAAIATISFWTVKNVKAESKTESHVNMINHSVTIPADLMKNHKFTQFNKAMRDLWYAHMYWTLITVDAYYNDPKGLEAKLTRLLQNQKDIGAAIVPYYGQAAGDTLAKLLTEHIQEAVPVLQAAKENNSKNLDKAVKDWYANAKEIGVFLHNANPNNWTAEQTGGALEMHITHTIDYSVSILKGNYSQSFGGFEEALHHMVTLADVLSVGIARQFPNQFK